MFSFGQLYWYLLTDFNFFTYSCIILYLAYVLFPQEGTCVPFPRLFSFVDPSLAIYSRDLPISGALFKDPCAEFVRLLWKV